MQNGTASRLWLVERVVKPIRFVDIDLARENVQSYALYIKSCDDLAAGSYALIAMLSIGVVQLRHNQRLIVSYYHTDHSLRYRV